ncbi:SDR family NAD(P)-dependent oxidoreductase [Pinibacter aurantiacus]|uniref:SDR family NAD(P)-dependent oxidoreductase n=1 Tax=Pinibacter aurantiacus TaxID=2851599 RepID=A0A9E2S9G0_9BACT|nr:SDR family NAD(P)-dependent oxidoreductase [Pinibacter aurantiacus]MBV4358836.1 SDR family NAD(P)-dependent oxidoreductase [Pinibacter aurantiacus]
MENKIILVTGATDGIGKITATSLAEQGHTVIVHGRNKQKAETVLNEIISKTGNKKIDILIADMLSLADVKRAAEEFEQKYPKLDVLVNNAGAIFSKNRETTTEGFEKTITLNLMAPTLLMLSLEKALEKSSSARIINMYSAMHKRGGKPDFSDFQLEKSYKPDRAYGLSKLYLVWATRHFAKLLKEKGIKNITVNGTHPGAVATNFGQEPDKGFLINTIFKVALRFMPKPEVGAVSSIYLATSPEVEKITGEFFDPKNKIEKPDDKYYSTANEQIVWDYCMSILQPYLSQNSFL